MVQRKKQKKTEMSLSTEPTAAATLAIEAVVPQLVAQESRIAACLRKLGLSYWAATIIAIMLTVVVAIGVAAAALGVILNK